MAFSPASDRLTCLLPTCVVLLLVAFDGAAVLAQDSCPDIDAYCDPRSKYFLLSTGVTIYNRSTSIPDYASCKSLCTQQSALWGSFSTSQPPECYCVFNCDGVIDAGTSATTSTFKVHCSSVSNDPHFVGARGTRYDFNGDIGKPYCLVSDKGFHLNGLFSGYESTSTVGASTSPLGKGIRTWIRELGLIWRDDSGVKHTLHMVAETGKLSPRASGLLKSVALDGTPLPVPKSPSSILEGTGVSLNFLGTKQKRFFNEDSYVLSLGSKVVIKFTLSPASPSYQLNNDSETHFNLMFQHLEATQAIHGVLGQTFRKNRGQEFKALKFSALAKILGEPVKADGASGHGFMDGSSGDYIVPNILSPDCSFSSFE